jgi:heme exporter protein CcmD
MNLSEFFAMGGNAVYVWTAYGITAILIAVEIAAVRARLKNAREAARELDGDA